MSKSSEKIESTNETLNKLIDLITTTVVATEKRASNTDDKIDKLTESMTASNIANAEARKDNKEIFKILTKHETNQKEQGVKLTAHGEVLAVHEVRINSSKSTLKEWGTAALSVIVAVIAAVIISKATQVNNMHETPKPQNNQPVRQHQKSSMPDGGTSSMTRALKQHVKSK